MQKLTALLAAAGLTALAAGAFAQTTATPAATPAAAPAAPAVTTDHVAAADANKDNKIDRAEYQKFMEVTFVTYDVNKDGNLKWSEVKEIIPVAAFKAADANGNNALSKSEFMTQVMKDFDAADRNADGALN